MTPFNPFTAVLSKVYAAVAVFCLSLALIQTVRIEGFLFVDGYKDEIASLEKQIVDNDRASDEAWLIAQKQVKDTEAYYAAKAKETEDVEATIRTVYVDRSNANAGRMRADKVCSALAAPTPGGDPAPRDNGPGPDAVVVARPDYDILVGNTARLEAIHQWGDALIKDGRAVVVGIEATQ